MSITHVETMFDARKTPWAGLGKDISGAVGSEEAIKQAGLDWDVVQSDVYTSDLNKAAGYKINIRSTDGKVLGVVTDRYKIVQNREAFAFTDALLGEGVKYETAGSLNNGKRVWMLAKLEGRLMTDEKIDPYLVFSNSHDGTGAIRVAITLVRIWCQNTLNLAIRTANRQWSCIHKGKIGDKMVEAKATLMNADHYLKQLEEEFGKLKLQRLTDDQVMDYINKLFPIDEGQTETKARNMLSRRRDVEERYFDAPDLKVLEKSKFRLINAVSDMATHMLPVRKTVNYQENLFMKTVDGNGIIDKAYAMLNE